MNKRQAYHALRMEHVEDIDEEELLREDEDTFVYTDRKEGIQYAIVDANGEIVISKMTFKEVEERMDQEHAKMVREYHIDRDLEDLGICTECLQPEELCICPDKLDGEES